MKNLQKLLLIALCASITPSTAVFCSETTTFPEESSTTIIIPNDASKQAFNNNIAIILTSWLTTSMGCYGFVAGASGSHALKNLKRKLRKSNDLTLETIAQTNKGIRNNRLGMAASLSVTMASATILNSSINSMIPKLRQNPTITTTHEPKLELPVLNEETA